VTSHAIVALLEEGATPTHACLPSIEWILHTQQDNGAWGHFQTGTAEETAYALIALLHYHRRERLTDASAVHRAAEYLTHYVNAPVESQPPLYIGKVLYAPYEIVRATILAALILYEETFARSS
jgi:halimadienyl-diphosphate synthase